MTGILAILKMKLKVVGINDPLYKDVLRIRLDAYRRYGIEDRLIDDEAIDRVSIVFISLVGSTPVGTGRCTPVELSTSGVRKRTKIPDRFVRPGVFELGRFAKLDCACVRGRLYLVVLILKGLLVMAYKYEASGYVGYARVVLMRRYKFFFTERISNEFEVGSSAHKYVAFYARTDGISKVIRWIRLFF